MSPNFSTVLEAAQPLPVSEQRETIELLMLGIDDSANGEGEGPPIILSAAWKEEIARCSAECDAGLARGNNARTTPQELHP